ncbi:putative ATP-dependent RNA helicase RhlE [Bacteriovorax sp. BSW11_IV]|uniref:DEAD/DEAH box helicase n=1 Tax=Bacteriovorax sp. BSW11_IV TaxID=1353529 RepID=UPI00038A2404|nr:DEAD/DEAH box helicase [Bacteriovorax sp. BSW11_IV]EQC43022.1 putative ATP-dependent RNA helicase RhlE [Bacteriovorax sp. BSW11_IV]
MKFSDMALCETLLKNVEKLHYKSPTPIQEKSIPHLLLGKDLIGVAETGSGKTASFLLPLLQYFHLNPRELNEKRKIKALILAPTRELAHQINDSISRYGKGLGLKSTVIIGGVGPNPQLKEIKLGVDILVATTGRLVDFLRTDEVDLSLVEYFVLDEADKMLDLGFSADVERIVKKLPKKRQTAIYSATMPDRVDELCEKILTDPIRVEVGIQNVPIDRIEQKIYFVRTEKKERLLAVLLDKENIKKALVFTRTKEAANQLVIDIARHGFKALAIHGNKTNGARMKSLNDFKKGEIEVLIATDIAARGIDVPDVECVFNFELPNEVENYVHRIGRTARAGKNGRAISFCDMDEEEEYLTAIEDYLEFSIPVDENLPYLGGNNVIKRTKHNKKRPQQKGGPVKKTNKRR